LNNKSFPDPNVPKAVVSRLSLYLRELQQLLRIGKATISSSKLGQRLGVTAAQVRKDFAYFGQFGYPGIGYKCEELVVEIRRILGTDRTWPVALIGCGNLGQALLGYRGFGKQGFRVTLAFDIDPNIVGQTYEGLTVIHLENMLRLVKQQDIRLAILAVPAKAANQAVDSLVEEIRQRRWRRFSNGTRATCFRRDQARTSYEIGKNCQNPIFYLVGFC
jgi:redox-sensing transcriptional repressor